jgi:hypothetical protein
MSSDESVANWLRQLEADAQQAAGVARLSLLWRLGGKGCGALSVSGQGSIQRFEDCVHDSGTGKPAVEDHHDA